MNKTLWAMLISGGILGAIYLVSFIPSSSGYGYAGHSSGFFFFSGGNSTVYHSRSSVRGGSPGGPNHTGGGTSRGK